MISKRRYLVFMVISILMIVAMMNLASAEKTSYTYTTPGSIVNVKLTIEQNVSKAVVAAFRLQYDHAVLELVDETGKTIRNDRVLVSAGLQDIASGYPIQVSFRIRDDSKGGEYTVSAKLLEAYDADENKVEDLRCSEHCVKIRISRAQQDAARGIVPGFDVTPENLKTWMLYYISSAESCHNAPSDGFPYQSLKEYPLVPVSEFADMNFMKYFEESGTEDFYYCYDMGTGKLTKADKNVSGENCVVYKFSSYQSDTYFFSTSIKIYCHGDMMEFTKEYQVYGDVVATYIYVTLKDEENPYMVMYAGLGDRDSYPDYELHGRFQ